MNKQENPLAHIFLKTSAITFIVFFCVFSYGINFFGLCFPSLMADLYGNLGFLNSSAMYYEKSYLRNPNAENLYLAIDKFILVKNYEKIIEYAPTLFVHEDYGVIIEQVNHYKAQFTVKPSGEIIKQEYALVCNEDNYLKRAFIEALLALGQYNDAEDFLEKSIETINLQQPVDSYLSVYRECSTTKVNGIYKAYFLTFVQEFETANFYESISDKDKIIPLHYIISLGTFFIDNEVNLLGFDLQFYKDEFLDLKVYTVR